MVSGWRISLHRQVSERDSPSDDSDPRGVQLATWQAGLGGLDWLLELATVGDAVHLSDNSGYPNRYTVRAAAVLPIVLHGPTDARTVWAAGSTDVLDADHWPGATTINSSEMAACDPEEWLQVEAWDES